jgi:hypothetical protein
MYRRFVGAEVGRVVDNYGNCVGGDFGHVLRITCVTHGVVLPPTTEAYTSRTTLDTDIRRRLRLLRLASRVGGHVRVVPGLR